MILIPGIIEKTFVDLTLPAIRGTYAADTTVAIGFTYVSAATVLTVLAAMFTNAILSLNLVSSILSKVG